MGSAGLLRYAVPAAVTVFCLALAGLGGGGALAIFTSQVNNGDNTFATGTWVTLYAAGDTYLKSGTPDANQGGESILRVQQTDTNRTLVQFDSTEIGNAAAGKTLRTAMLRLYVEYNGGDWGGSGGTVDVHRATVSWTEPGATWNCPVDSDTGNSSPDCASQWNGGTFNASPSASALHTNGLSGWVEWDVTADVIDMLATPAANNGWLVKKTDEGASGRADYSSRDGAANAPELFLVFTN